MSISLSIYTSQKLKYTDTLLVILDAVYLLVGLAGCFLPILPGLPATYSILWLLYFTGYVELMVAGLVVWGLPVASAQVVDYVTPMLGIKHSGGFKWGGRGCVVGIVAGMSVFPPWGILLGPFVGELLGDRASGGALKTGFRAFTSSLLSAVLKVTLCGYFIYSLMRGITN